MKRSLKIKTLIALVLVLSTVFSSIPAMAASKAKKPVSKSEIKFRVFAIGNANYKGDNKLPGCKNDLEMVKEAYKNATFYGKKAEITTRLNLTGNEIRKMLAAMSTTGATSDDVTIFYYTGHGMNGGGYNGALCGVDWDLVTVNEVQKLLDKVPGKVVVMLDCCLSGQYIKTKSAALESESFNEAFLAPFVEAQAKALTNSPVKKKYKIITASGPRQSSYISAERKFECSVFTDYLAQAMGVEYKKGSVKMQADKNKNNVVTLKELYSYVNGKVKKYCSRSRKTTQKTMVWPSNDSTPVIARN